MPAVETAADLRVILAALEQEIQLYLSTGMRVSPGRLILWIHEVRLAQVKASEKPLSRVDGEWS